MTAEQMLTVLEVAHYLQVHPTTVRRWEKEGRLKSYRIGQKGMLRFQKKDIMGFVTGEVKAA